MEFTTRDRHLFNQALIIAINTLNKEIDKEKHDANMTEYVKGLEQDVKDMIFLQKRVY